MLIPFLSGTLPGWPAADNPPWLLLLAIMVGIPFLVLAAFWVLGSGRAWLKAAPGAAAEHEVAARERVAIADDIADIEAADEVTPDGPNRHVADRVRGSELTVAPEREVKAL